MSVPKLTSHRDIYYPKVVRQPMPNHFPEDDRVHAHQTVSTPEVSTRQARAAISGAGRMCASDTLGLTWTEGIECDFSSSSETHFPGSESGAFPKATRIKGEEAAILKVPYSKFNP